MTLFPPPRRTLLSFPRATLPQLSNTPSTSAWPVAHTLQRVSLAPLAGFHAEMRLPKAGDSTYRDGTQLASGLTALFSLLITAHWQMYPDRISHLCCQQF